jgi:peptidoglycan/xylan/chitin deacetylase (PgdA/CDA1 family)
MRFLALALVPALATGIPRGLRGRELDHLPTRKREVALTIDAGGESAGGWRIARTLVRRRVPATFFLTGRWASQNARLARFLGARFVVGNHSWSHPPLTSLTTAAVALEIRRGAAAIRRFAGRDPRPLFRFPFGDSDARTLRLVNDLGYVSVRWTVDTLAWTGTQTVLGGVQRVVSRLEPGAIILMHVGTSVDTRALPRVIDAVRRRGYRFTTLARLGR